MKIPKQVRVKYGEFANEKLQIESIRFDSSPITVSCFDPNHCDYDLIYAVPDEAVFVEGEYVEV